MSTHAMIGVLRKTGYVMSIYLHHDGYFSYAGRTLFSHYKTLDQLDSLMTEGNASSIAATIEDCEFYERDRHETNCGCRRYESVVEWRTANLDHAEFFYLFVTDEADFYNDSKWLGAHGTEPLTPLVDILDKLI